MKIYPEKWRELGKYGCVWKSTLKKFVKMLQYDGNFIRILIRVAACCECGYEPICTLWTPQRLLCHRHGYTFCREYFSVWVSRAERAWLSVTVQLCLWTDPALSRTVGWHIPYTLIVLILLQGAKSKITSKHYKAHSDCVEAVRPAFPCVIKITVFLADCSDGSLMLDEAIVCFLHCTCSWRGNATFP